MVNECNLTVQELLYKYPYIKFEIDQVNDEIINIADIIEEQRNIKIPIITGLPKGSDISDPVFSGVMKILDIYTKETAKLETKLEYLFRQKNLIENMMKHLNKSQTEVIRYRYFKKYKWWMIANSMNYSEKHCRRIERKALEILEKVKNNESNEQ